MIVMSNHKWKDSDIEQVLFDGHKNNREIDFKTDIEAIIINKKDVIALANEFGLVVYEEESRLR